MDKQRMTFEINRRTVTEGDIVEISWQCQGADSVMLTLDNGFRTSEIALDNSGTKRFRLNRSKGRTKLDLKVMLQGKEHHKVIKVKVKKMPTVKAETLDSNGRAQSWLTLQWQKVMTKWRELTAKFNIMLQALPLKKQLAAKVLMLIGVMLLISAIWPRFYSFALTLVAIYLIVVLARK